MAENLKADLKLSASVVIGRDDYATQYTELAGNFVKIEKGKLFVLVNTGGTASSTSFVWAEAKDQ